MYLIFYGKILCQSIDKVVKIVLARYMKIKST